MASLLAEAASHLDPGLLSELSFETDVQRNPQESLGTLGPGSSLPLGRIQLLLAEAQEAPGHGLDAGPGAQLAQGLGVE